MHEHERITRVGGEVNRVIDGDAQSSDVSPARAEWEETSQLLRDCVKEPCAGHFAGLITDQRDRFARIHHRSKSKSAIRQCVADDRTAGASCGWDRKNRWRAVTQHALTTSQLCGKGVRVDWYQRINLAPEEVRRHRLDGVRARRVSGIERHGDSLEGVEVRHPEIRGPIGNRDLVVELIEY